MRYLVKQKDYQNKTLFDEFFNTDFDFALRAGRNSSNFPTVDITETKSEFLISLNVPGVSKEDLSIDVKGQTLTISGERKDLISGEDQKIVRRESNFGTFKRGFTLPKEADLDKIEASHTNGVLTISLKKSEAAASKRIEIKGFDS